MRKRDGYKINGICQDSVGLIMIGTDFGLITFSEAEGKWALLTAKNSVLPDDSINCVMEDKKGHIWLGTKNGIVVLAP